MRNVTEKFNPELMKKQHDYRVELKELKVLKGLEMGTETVKCNKARIKELKDKILPRLSREQKKAQEDVTAWLLLGKAKKKAKAPTSLKYLAYNKERSSIISCNKFIAFEVKTDLNYAKESVSLNDDLTACELTLSLYPNMQPIFDRDGAEKVEIAIINTYENLRKSDYKFVKEVTFTNGEKMCFNHDYFTNTFLQNKEYKNLYMGGPRLIFDDGKKQGLLMGLSSSRVTGELLESKTLNGRIPVTTDAQFSNPKVNNYHKLGKYLKAVGVNIPLDGKLSLATGEVELDLLKLETMIPNYDADKCTYKGKPEYSMRMAIEEEWGTAIAELVKKVM